MQISVSEGKGNEETRIWRTSGLKVRGGGRVVSAARCVWHEGCLSTYVEPLRGTTQDTEADTEDTGG